MLYCIPRPNSTFVDYHILLCRFIDFATCHVNTILILLSFYFLRDGHNGMTQHYVGNVYCCLASPVTGVDIQATRKPGLIREG